MTTADCFPLLADIRRHLCVGGGGGGNNVVGADKQQQNSLIYAWSSLSKQRQLYIDCNDDAKEDNKDDDDDGEDDSHCSSTSKETSLDLSQEHDEPISSSSSSPLPRQTSSPFSSSRHDRSIILLTTSPPPTSSSSSVAADAGKSSKKFEYTKTHIPDFHLDDLDLFDDDSDDDDSDDDDDDEDYDDSDDDDDVDDDEDNLDNNNNNNILKDFEENNNNNNNNNKYCIQEDKDVEVFLRITDRMSIQTTLHLLQGHVRALNLCTAQKYYYNTSNNRRRITKGSSSSNNNKATATTVAPRLPPPPLLPKKKKKILLQKKFRWAEVTNHQVRTVIHKVEPWDPELYNDLWWNDDDFRTIKNELIQTILFLSKYQHGHIIESLELIIKGTSPESVIDEHMKGLTTTTTTTTNKKEEESSAHHHHHHHRHHRRGLESHIVRKLVGQYRKKHIRRVLNAQVSNKCRHKERTYDEACEILRQQSLENSKLLVTFAERMGQYDEIEALTD